MPYYHYLAHTLFLCLSCTYIGTHWTASHSLDAEECFITGITRKSSLCGIELRLSDQNRGVFVSSRIRAILAEAVTHYQISLIGAERLRVVIAEDYYIAQLDPYAA